MAVENQHNAVENLAIFKKIQNDVSHYLLDTFKTKESNDKKDQIINEINQHLTYNQRNEVIDYIKSQALNVSEYQNCDDQNQLLFLLKWLNITEENFSDVKKHIYEFWACVLNNTWPLAKKEMPSYESTYNPDLNWYPDNAINRNEINNLQEFRESNDVATYNIKVTRWTITQKTLTASFKHWFDNKNVTYNILWSNAHYRWNWFYEIDLFARWWNINNEKKILIRYDWWDAFDLINPKTKEAIWIAELWWERYSITPYGISTHWRKVNLKFEQNWVKIDIWLSISPKRDY